MINLLFFTFLALACDASTLQVVTTEFPPFQYTENDKVKGITTEIVENVIENAGYQSKIKSYPWARTLKLGIKEQEVLIYSIVRSPEREKSFKWIGTIAPYKVYFWKLKKRKDIKVNSIEDAVHYKCGATAGDIKTDHLLKVGFALGKNLEIVSSDQQNIRRLFAGKIDLMTHDDLSFRSSVATEKLDFSLVEKLIYLNGSARELQLAASLGTSDAVVEKLRASLAAFKKTKKYDEIKNRLK